VGLLAGRKKSSREERWCHVVRRWCLVTRKHIRAISFFPRPLLSDIAAISLPTLLRVPPPLENIRSPSSPPLSLFLFSASLSFLSLASSSFYLSYSFIDVFISGIFISRSPSGGELLNLLPAPLILPSLRFLPSHFPPILGILLLPFSSCSLFFPELFGEGTHSLRRLSLAVFVWFASFFLLTFKISAKRYKRLLYENRGGFKKGPEQKKGVGYATYFYRMLPWRTQAPSSSR
jgi:hypothetical protein